MVMGRPLNDVPEEALFEMTDMLVHMKEIKNNPLARSDLKARLEREVKAVEERVAFRKSIQYTCTRLLASRNRATQHLISNDYAKAGTGSKRYYRYNDMAGVGLPEFEGVQAATADGFTSQRAALDLLQLPSQAPTIFNEERSIYLHEVDINRIRFWQTLGFNFVNRPRGVLVAAIVNDGQIRDKQIIDLEDLQTASTRGFKVSPLVGDEVQWLNVIFHDEVDAHYVLVNGDLSEFGCWFDSIEKVLP